MYGRLGADDTGKVFGEVVRLAMAEIAADRGNLAVARRVQPRPERLSGMRMNGRMRDGQRTLPIYCRGGAKA